ncbi:MAG: metallophosphoesterase [Nitrospiraceae bacterium]|nr:MAG: metallophosphoesterase [Nitrospiraceae bacterium]
MYVFFIVFFTIYGLMHYYAFSKAQSALPFNALRYCLVITWIVLMIFAPFIIRHSERLGFERLAILLSYVAYVWMGILFLFIVVSLLIDFIKLLWYIAGKILSKDLSFISPAGKTSFFLPLAVSIIISGYGYYEAEHIRIENIIVQTPKLPADIDLLRIVQISDVHLGLIVREKRLKKILDLVAALKPDILVSTGDLVDGQIDKFNGLSDLFNEIEPQYGKFAITGNHEFYAGLVQALDFTEKAGFTILRGEAVNIEGVMNIAGVDDKTALSYGLYRDVDEKTLLSTIDQSLFTLLLKHRPRVNETSKGFFDLQLSGHTHKGQIFPFSLVTAMYFPQVSGLFHVQDTYSLYVSRGTGTWGPPIRFLSPPEVTAVDIVPLRQTGQ